MRERDRLGFLTSVVQMLNEAESWTGRMHIQKLVYFAQKLLNLESGYDFVLYQRGPYSFDLDADIRSLRSIGAVDIVPAPYPYGPTYQRAPLGEAISKLSPVEEQMNARLAELSRLLGPRSARDLELLATTHYVLHEGHESDRDIVQRVRLLKPQFSEDEISAALDEVRELERQF